MLCLVLLLHQVQFWEPASKRHQLRTAVNAALNKMLRGQERKAFKLLCSNGVAKINPATVLALQKLHPERKSDLVLPSTNFAQLSIDREFVTKKLFRESADHNLSKDVYGWALFQM